LGFRGLESSASKFQAISENPGASDEIPGIVLHVYSL
jgi:hypothetical protein